MFVVNLIWRFVRNITSLSIWLSYNRITIVKFGFQNDSAELGPNTSKDKIVFRAWILSEERVYHEISYSISHSNISNKQVPLLLNQNS